MMDSVLHPPFLSLPLRRLVTFQWSNYHCGMHNSLINYRCQHCLCFSMEGHHAKAASVKKEQYWWTIRARWLGERSWQRDRSLWPCAEICQMVLHLLLTDDRLETHGTERSSIFSAWWTCHHSSQYWRKFSGRPSIRWRSAQVVAGLSTMKARIICSVRVPNFINCSKTTIKETTGRSKDLIRSVKDRSEWWSDYRGTSMQRIIFFAKIWT